MSTNFLIGLAAGTGVSNFLIYKFLWGASWTAAAGFGVISAGICIILVAILKCFK